MMERQHIEMIVFKIDYFKQRQNYGKAEGKKSVNGWKDWEESSKMGGKLSWHGRERRRRKSRVAAAASLDVLRI